MAIPSFSLDTAANSAAGLVKGAVRTVSAPFGSAEGVAGSVGNALGGVAKGAVRAGTSIIDGAVGGTANRKLITGAVQDIIGGGKTVLGKPGNPGEIVGNVLGAIGGAANTYLAGSGNWGYLSPFLLANIYACDADGIIRIDEPLMVTGPMTDSNFEGTFNWQSPFESTGPEAKAPALMAMLQSGSLVPVLNALQAVNPIQSDTINGALNSAADKARAIAKDLEGRTGITKLNSRQVFSGMPPVKITFVIHFRAVTDAMSEVVEPYMRLMEWALPQQLAKDGVLTEVIASTGSQNSSMLKAMFPSRSPLLVGLTHGRNRYAPMVIESVSHILDGPLDSTGLPIYRAVQLTLATLTAIDRNDFRGTFN